MTGSDWVGVAIEGARIESMQKRQRFARYAHLVALTVVVTSAVITLRILWPW